MKRIEKEKRIVGLMMRIYCRGRHQAGKEALCDECAALLAYAQSRLERCPNFPDKTSCRRCTIHCYSPEHRRAIKEVMRYAGPRMLFRHPIIALKHLLQ
ncbi:MAG: nitrous oxide-stimulated promoter family protein [Muribaculaceae bacterium]|nr:nitrous oxide-stimulated promoter family protein [Muribaculaceae bacterium]MDE5968887.1 nitrous oxide-stimulated promoter family protein [Muribaculaceae bacterium]